MSEKMVEVEISVPKPIWNFYLKRLTLWNDPERSASYDFVDGGIRSHLDAIDLDLDPEARELKPLVEEYLEKLKNP